MRPRRCFFRISHGVLNLKTLKNLLYCSYLHGLFVQVIGASILGIGIYAEIEKRDYEAVTDVFVSPSSLMIAVGAIMFILGFVGCIGVLRENITLLKIVSICQKHVFYISLGIYQLIRPF